MFMSTCFRGIAFGRLTKGAATVRRWKMRSAIVIVHLQCLGTRSSILQMRSMTCMGVILCLLSVLKGSKQHKEAKTSSLAPLW